MRPRGIGSFALALVAYLGFDGIDDAVIYMHGLVVCRGRVGRVCEQTTEQALAGQHGLGKAGELGVDGEAATKSPEATASR